MVTFLKDGLDLSFTLYLILNFGATILVKNIFFFSKNICFPYLENPSRMYTDATSMTFCLLSVLHSVAQRGGWLALSLS